MIVQGQLTEQQINDIVSVHNKFRHNAGILYGPPPISPLNSIKWDVHMASKMQSFVSTCQLNSFPDPKYSNWGYTSFRIINSNFNPFNLLDRIFTTAASLYDWKTAGCINGSRCEMYPTLTWNASTAIGCGKAVCSGDKVWMVCAYNPIGGFVGVKPYTPKPNIITTTKPTPTVTPISSSPPTTPAPSISTNVATSSAVQNTTFPTTLDWRWKGAVTSIKNQGQCGGCWSFSSAATLESQYLIKNGKTAEQYDIDLSEQHFINCAANGCNGGNAVEAFKTLLSTGVMYEDAYTYKALTLECPTALVGPTFKWSGYKNIPANKDAFIAELQNGPIYVSIYTDSGFMRYSTGVYSCPVANNPNHAVTIIGYDLVQNYWIVKNSWGQGWGSSGLINLDMSACSIYRYRAFRPIL
ncbi:hypothetical protein DFA_07405 [Cavenderia fasciculata]|uniref:Gamete and mating-type specific protein A n=1 Tax=Cavenderia fasciculata TaxID=261658 RepID=F4PWB8_CACFS|nr:uncharacterized protein DFA_07405 [Cavenderia fasciculata]EGG20282.1 hypothetical protein DFA_07405 [Cavenderia fasciculata]|eukprot:XP_004367265.1 hypothetical protein DFA_07405 [Cavenderia fasciculata]